MKKYEDYSNEVFFSVGQRVHVELSDIPKEQRDVTTGVIVDIRTHFPSTPKHRLIRITVRFDGKGNYVKEEFRMRGGIQFEFTCNQDKIIALKE